VRAHAAYVDRQFVPPQLRVFVDGLVQHMQATAAGSPP
jgi:hypothetical protein